MFQFSRPPTGHSAFVTPVLTHATEGVPSVTAMVGHQRDVPRQNLTRVYPAVGPLQERDRANLMLAGS